MNLEKIKKKEKLHLKVNHQPEAKARTVTRKLARITKTKVRES